jgi:sensor histidine kinase YesM
MIRVKTIADIYTMTQFIKRKNYKFYLYVGAAWLGLWIFNSFISYQYTFELQIWNEIWRTIYIIGINFIFFEFGLPLILKKRSSPIFSVLSGILSITLLFILISFGLVAWKHLGMELNIYTSFRHAVLIPGGAYSHIIEDALYQTQGGISSVFFFGFAKLFYTNFKLRQTAQQLRLEKQEAELNYLKSQTNPHFLFNTLNNIYSLARDNSDLAAESILRLSKILRFMLYETNAKFISVKQELDIINDYISLEKLRYDDSLKIIFKQEADDINELIPPLLMITLVENAFKHGVSEISNQKFIDIQLSVKEKQLRFVVKNSTGHISEEKYIKENIGLSNLRRQLELLYKDFNLSLSHDNSSFTAVLKINLSSYV